MTFGQMSDAESGGVQKGRACVQMARTCTRHQQNGLLEVRAMLPLRRAFWGARNAQSVTATAGLVPIDLGCTASRSSGLLLADTKGMAVS